MHDLNDLFVFSQVVEHKGFTGAARALGLARSSICRRVGQLEEELGVRLIQRNTRHFTVTEIGQTLYTHCSKIVCEANAAYEHIACARERPSGLIRMSCPAIVAQILIGPLIPQFMEKHPEVRIGIEATSRKVDLEDNFDLSVRVHQLPSQDSGMILRSLGIVQQVLVASPAFLARTARPATPALAAKLATVGFGCFQGPHVWKLVDKDEKELQIRHDPKFISDDMALVRQAAVQGIGIAQMPLAVCLNEIRQGQLQIVFPEFRAPLFEIQVVYPSRHGQLPAVRSFIEFLGVHCVSEVAEHQIKRHVGAGRRETPSFWTSRQPLDPLITGKAVSRAADAQARVA